MIGAGFAAGIGLMPGVELIFALVWNVVVAGLNVAAIIQGGSSFRSVGV
jgi:hypothetical protein